MVLKIIGNPVCTCYVTCIVLLPCLIEKTGRALAPPPLSTPLHLEHTIYIYGTTYDGMKDQSAVVRTYIRIQKNFHSHH